MSKLAHQIRPGVERRPRRRAAALIWQSAVSRRGAAAGVLVCPFLLAGCLERTVTITSNPPGALVMLNDVEVGRTPVTTGFTFYGDFDVRLRKEGYEPLVTHRETATPIYEYAPLDLAATAWPGRIRTKLVWNFDLTPLPDAKEGEAGLLERAGQMKDEVAPKRP